MVEPELELVDVSLRFGGLQALAEVTLAVDRGSIHALIGPNGAGKSTCFNVISGVYRPDSGRITIRGRDVTGVSTRRLAAQRVARTFQNLVLCEQLTVEDNIYAARHRHDRSGVGRTMLGTRGARRRARFDRDVVRRVAADVGVHAVLDRPLATLPYGMRKRVELARVLAAEPSLVLLDEPAAGLNDAETAQLATVIHGLRDRLGLTVLLVEHDMGLVMEISDRVSVLNFGRLIADGPPAEIRRSAAVIDAYLGTVISEEVSL